MTTAHESQPARERVLNRQWLWDHIGRLSGIALGLIAFALVVFLAVVGFPPAYGLLVLVVIGVLMIFLGGRIRGG